MIDPQVSCLGYWVDGANQEGCKGRASFWGKWLSLHMELVAFIPGVGMTFGFQDSFKIITLVDDWNELCPRDLSKHDRAKWQYKIGTTLSDLLNQHHHSTVEETETQRGDVTQGRPCRSRT